MLGRPSAQHSRGRDGARRSSRRRVWRRAGRRCAAGCAVSGGLCSESGAMGCLPVGFASQGCWARAGLATPPLRAGTSGCGVCTRAPTTASAPPWRPRQTTAATATSPTPNAMPVQPHAHRRRGMAGAVHCGAGRRQAGRGGGVPVSPGRGWHSVTPAPLISWMRWKPQRCTPRPWRRRANAPSLGNPRTRSNRWRRHRVQPPELRADISPKNILMIGPTGCGKTEIARRLAQLADAPFVKASARVLARAWGSAVPWCV